MGVKCCLQWLIKGIIGQMPSSTFHSTRMIIKTLCVAFSQISYLFWKSHFACFDKLFKNVKYLNNLEKRMATSFIIIIITICYFLRKNANLAEVLLACWLNTYTMWVWDGLGRVWHIKKKRWYGKECKKSSRQKGRYFVYSHFGAKGLIRCIYVDYQKKCNKRHFEK